MKIKVATPMASMLDAREDERALRMRRELDDDDEDDDNEIIDVIDDGDHLPDDEDDEDEPKPKKKTKEKKAMTPYEALMFVRDEADQFEASQRVPRKVQEHVGARELANLRLRLSDPKANVLAELHESAERFENPTRSRLRGRTLFQVDANGKPMIKMELGK